MPTNDSADPNDPRQKPRDADNPGYETTDVNVNGVVVFIGGLLGFVIIFFFFCFGMGRIINLALKKQDGPIDKWHQVNGTQQEAGGGPALGQTARQNLASGPEMQQKELQGLTATFPEPRMDTDDGMQAIADLHAREDLLLEHNSVTPGEQGIRIPIERAMELIAQRGLPVAAGAATSAQLAEDSKPQIQAPLTTGFARTGYELDTIEARAQRLSYSNAQAGAHAELRPVR